MISGPLGVKFCKKRTPSILHEQDFVCENFICERIMRFCLLCFAFVFLQVKVWFGKGRGGETSKLAKRRVGKRGPEKIRGVIDRRMGYDGI